MFRMLFYILPLQIIQRLIGSVLVINRGVDLINKVTGILLAINILLIETLI